MNGRCYGIVEENKKKLRDVKNEGDFARCGWAQGPGSCHSISVSKLMGLVHSEIVEISNFDSFKSLKSCGGRGWMVVRHTH